MFDKMKYIKQRQWENDDRLLDADTAVKRCQCCGERKYSVEFPNVYEYEDGKLPVCFRCFTKKKTAELAVGIVAENSKIRICRKCDTGYPMENFVQVRVGFWDVSNVCQDCS